MTGTIEKANAASRASATWLALGLALAGCSRKSELSLGADPEVVITGTASARVAPRTPGASSVSAAESRLTPQREPSSQRPAKASPAKASPAKASLGIAAVEEKPAEPELLAQGQEGESQFRAGAELRIKRVVVTEAVDGREPVGSGKALDVGQPAIAFVEVESGPGAPHTIQVVFEHESGKRVGFVSLEIPAERVRWRTWGRTQRIDRAGAWVARVLDERGAEIGRADFRVDD